MNTNQQRTITQKSSSDIQRATEDAASDFQTLVDGIGGSIQEYGKKHPGMCTGMVFFLGFYLGWKIKPW